MGDGFSVRHMREGRSRLGRRNRATRQRVTRRRGHLLHDDWEHTHPLAGIAGVLAVLGQIEGGAADHHASDWGLPGHGGASMTRLRPRRNNERHFRRAVAEFVTHYQCERNHQGLGTELIEVPPAQERVGRIRRRSRLGGLLNYYARAA